MVELQSEYEKMLEEKEVLEARMEERNMQVCSYYKTDFLSCSVFIS